MDSVVENDLQDHLPRPKIMRKVEPIKIITSITTLIQGDVILLTGWNF